jgi:hypothetical protein
MRTSPAVHRLLSFFGRLLVLVGILDTSVLGIGRPLLAQEALHPMVEQATPYRRHRPGPAYGHRTFMPPLGGMIGYPGARYGFRGYVPWYPGGFHSPPVYGSWYQRPYPYHFDIYRGQFGGNSQIRPDATKPFEQPPWDYPSETPE